MGKLNILNKFLSKHILNVQAYHSKIATVKKHSYATNGKIICRTKGNYGTIGDYLDVNSLPWDALQNGQYFEISKTEFNKSRESHQCNCHPKGTGKLIICPECKGEGCVSFSNDYNTYDFDCETCFGEGESSAKTLNSENCPRCSGTRFQSTDSEDFYIFTDIIVHPQLVAIATEIPNVKFCLTPHDFWGKANHLLGFRSPDYEGFISPRIGDGY